MFRFCVLFRFYMPNHHRTAYTTDLGLLIFWPLKKRHCDFFSFLEIFGFCALSSNDFFPQVFGHVEILFSFLLARSLSYKLSPKFRIHCSQTGCDDGFRMLVLDGPFNSEEWAVHGTAARKQRRRACASCIATLGQRRRRSRALMRILGTSEVSGTFKVNV